MEKQAEHNEVNLSKQAQASLTEYIREYIAILEFSGLWDDER